MNITFKNDCTVNRVWKDTTSELLAAFQYESHAVDFARDIAADTTIPAGVFYVASSNYDGKVTDLRTPFQFTASGIEAALTLLRTGRSALAVSALEAALQTAKDALATDRGTDR